MANQTMDAHPAGRPLGSAPAPSDLFVKGVTAPAAGAVGADISREIVGLLRDHTGRGPTQAKTTIASDLVVVSLADCLTTLERQLSTEGETELVAAARHAIHDGMRSEAIAIVERHTYRPVAAYLTAHQDDPDVAVLAFVLAPPNLQIA